LGAGEDPGGKAANKNENTEKFSKVGLEASVGAWKAGLRRPKKIFLFF
jgi:hypothetical protein